MTTTFPVRIFQLTIVLGFRPCGGAILRLPDTQHGSYRWLDAGTASGKR